MKRILLPAGGAILATGLLAAGLAGTAVAAPADADPTAANLAQRAEEVKATLDFWTKSNNAALRKATAYHYDFKTVDKKIVEKGSYQADTKPHSVAPIGYEAKKTVKYQNVNIPKNLGKVFFEARDGSLHWCSGTSIQSKYRNMVATAGNCVYDLKANNEVVSRWVFVPMYYQGKTPAGIYVGKQAFTHYDFSTYEDWDRNYAFVTVYNGLGVKGSGGDLKQVDRKTYEDYKGDKEYKDVAISKEDYAKCVLDPKSFCYAVDGSPEKVVGPEYPGAVVDKTEVTKGKYTLASVGRGQGFKFGEPVTEFVDEATYKAYTGPGSKVKDAQGNYTITHYYVQKWFLPGTDAKYFGRNFYVVNESVITLTDLGRLGDNVGGQGFAWNQPLGKYVRVFGYPFAQHPDGSKPYSGVTPKWCYAKTSKITTEIAAIKAQDLQSIPCAMTGGSDGGPWLSGYSNAKRVGYLTGVTAGVYGDLNSNDRIDTIYSSIFDSETAEVYNAAANVWSGKVI